MRKLFFAFFVSIFLFIPGCGYTTHSLLPTDIKTIYVDNFKNGINITGEQSNVRMYRGYAPGMERELTRSVMDKFLFDGNLRLASVTNADLVLTGELTDFKRDALRYDTNDNVEEYRIKIIVNIALENRKTGKIMWTEKGFTGETTYRTTGPLAKTDAAGISAAIDDIARRIVERTIEAW